jgi:hypothetical protein
LLLASLFPLPSLFGAFLLLPLTACFVSLPPLFLRLLVVATLFLSLVVIATLFVPLAPLVPALLSLLAPRILSLIAVALVLSLDKTGQAERCTDTETQSYKDGSQVIGFHKGPPCVNCGESGLTEH